MSLAVVAGRFCASDTVRPATRTTRSAGSSMRFITSSLTLLKRSVVETGPQVPARDRPIGAPRFADPDQPVRRRRLPQPIGALHRLDDAEVADRQHIGAVQPE